MFRRSAPAPATGAGPEWELLVRCARTSRSAGCSARIRDLVRRDVDWDRVVELASVHRVMPLLYQNVLAVCPDAVPSATMDGLERSFSSNVARNLALTFELLDLLKWLGTHEIPAIPFKGPTLASVAYGSLALREAGDLDVLVHRRDAIRAKHLLMSRGFRTDPGLTEDQEFERGHHFRLVRDDRPMTVEIHWRLVSDCLHLDLGEEALWRDVSRCRVAGMNVPCFPTPGLLLFLCVHGAKHCWHRLGWICDLEVLIRSHREIDWDVVRREARGIGAERMLSVGLLLAIDLLGAPLDEAAARGIKADATASELAREVLERYLPAPDGPPDFAARWTFNLKARERRRDRLRCRLKLIVPAMMPNERDFAFLRLPTALSFLYHAVKPVRLLGKYGSNPSGFLRLINDLVGFRCREAPHAMRGASTRFRPPESSE